jgi:membrane protein implicated in regulation of membrane protease activity
LVWHKRSCPWVLAVGVMMHLLIMMTIAVGFFTFAIFVFYLAFVPPKVVQRLPRTARHLATKLPGRSVNDAYSR